MRAKKGGLGAGPTIPDFLKVEPDKRAGAIKEHIVDVMKPTPDLLNQVQANPALLAGFDDPEVMAAVAEARERAHPPALPHLTAQSCWLEGC